MDIKTFELMCNREFRMIRGLYHPSDTIEVKDRATSLSCKYRSNRYSISDPSKDSYEDSTMIMFDEFSPKLKICDIGALINFIAVHPQVRGRGFGRKMVTAVESIFRQRGWDRLGVENVDNSEFWLKMGYVLRTIKDKDIEYEFYTKILS